MVDDPTAPKAYPPGLNDPAEKGKIKLRLTLGPALIDLEATPAEIVDVVTKLTQEFGKAKIIGL